MKSALRILSAALLLLVVIAATSANRTLAAEPIGNSLLQRESLNGLDLPAGGELVLEVGVVDRRCD